MIKKSKIILAVAFILAAVIIIPNFLRDDSSEYIHPSLLDKNNSGPKTYPSQWAWVKRTFPFDKADPKAIPQAVSEAKMMRSLAKKESGVLWQFAGPENIGGRVVDIEFNPQNPNIVYAAAATGGVFKSYDTGLTWQPVFDEQAVLTIGDIGIDPVNPDIIYVGTGEANGGHNNFPGFGIYKSTNGGETWQHKGLDSTASIGRILIDPQNNSRVWVAAVGSYFEPNPQRGIYLSEDGGEIWQMSLFVSDSTGAIDLVMDADNPDFMMAAMWERVRRPVYRDETHLWGETSAIWRTSDGGRSWAQLGTENGLPDPQSEQVGRIGLSMHTQNTDILFALYNDGSNPSGLFRTDDGGDNWTRVADQTDFSGGAGGFSWYFGQVRVHPTNPDRVYVMDVAFMRTDDGGDSWPLKNRGDGSLHVDHHALAFHPQNPNYIISGNDGGINISDDGGDSWSKVSSLPVTQFYEIGLDASNSKRLYGGTQDNGTLRTVNGYIDQWANILGGDGFYVIVDPTDPEIVYAEWQFGGLWKIDNGKKSYIVNSAMESEKRNWSTPVIMDPVDNNVLYYGTNRIWRTENAGAGWSAISEDLTRGLPDSRVGTVTTIAVAPSNSDVIYTGTDDGLVWVSADYGTSWSNISDSLPFRWVTRVKVDPQNDSIAYVTYSGLRWRDPQPHVFRTDDMGKSWQNITSNLPDAPVNAFAVDPRNRDILYSGLDVGAFVSFDAGGSWSVLGEGLPVVVVNDMKINKDSYEIIVGTHGRSMYKIDLQEVTGIQTDQQFGELPKTFVLNQNYPNPFNPKTVIGYQLPVSSSVELNIYNVLGQKVATLVSEKQPVGNYKVEWDASGFASGVYLYKLKTDKGFVQSKKLMLIK